MQREGHSVTYQQLFIDTKEGRKAVNGNRERKVLIGLFAVLASELSGRGLGNFPEKP